MKYDILMPYTRSEDLTKFNIQKGEVKLSTPKSTKKIVKEGIDCLKIFCISNFHFHTRFTLTKWIRNYNRSDFISDFIAGIIIAFIMVVQSIAIALVIGVSPEYSLYSSIFGGIVNFFFGTSKDLSTGPTLIGAVILARYNIHESAQVMSLIAFFNGIFFLLMSFINLGFLMEFISYPVLTGWITAGAVTIFISQLPSWLGIFVPDVNNICSYQVIIYILKHIKNVKNGDLLIGTISFVLTSTLYFVGKRIRNILHTFSKRSAFSLKIILYIITARIGWIIILFSFLSNLLIKYSFIKDITFFNSPPSGLPLPWNPFNSITVQNTTYSFQQIIYEVYPSFFLTPFVILIETLAGARNFGKQFKYQVDNNQEIMCLGITNVLNSLFRGFTVGSALARTSVNALSGVKSLFGGLITSLLLIPTLLFLTPLIKFISKASLGACICSAALTQIQVTSLINLWKISKLQLLPWIVTFFAGLYGLEVGILVGFVVSAGFIMFRELRPRIYSEYDRQTETASLHIKGAIHFPGAYSISTRVRTIKNFHPNIQKLIIDCTNMYETDTSVVEELKEAIESLSKEGVDISLIHVKKGRVQDLLFGAGLSQYIFKGMRTNSCIDDFHHGRHPHVIAFHCNPRDLYNSNIQDDMSENLSIQVDIENDNNYLYTVRSGIN